MSMVKCDPIKELEDVSNRLSHLFKLPLTQAELNQEMLVSTDWIPSADISETDTAYLIKAEIPGVKKEDVKVTLQNGMLIFQGERKMEKEEKGKKFHRIERAFGSFLRSFRMPDDIDKSNIKAEFKEGLLSITLKKSDKTKAKNSAINISVS